MTHCPGPHPGTWSPWALSCNLPLPFSLNSPSDSSPVPSALDSCSPVPSSPPSQPLPQLRPFSPQPPPRPPSLHSLLAPDCPKYSPKGSCSPLFKTFWDKIAYVGRKGISWGPLAPLPALSSSSLPEGRGFAAEVSSMLEPQTPPGWMGTSPSLGESLSECLVGKSRKQKK